MLALAAIFALRSSRKAPVVDEEEAEAPAAPIPSVRLAKVLAAFEAAKKAPAPNEAKPITVDERIAERAKGDPIAAVVPSLTGMPKATQLEMLKAMQSWPEHKFMWQVPSLARATDLPIDERIALSEELNRNLIATLEGEGVHAELPKGFTPVATREPPLSEFGEPTPAR
ncbi:MAG TPA: hypothetical protein VHJ20_17430 [Polyangia bacterium]|nr:hypothetical protein [Polyangia bacterium]